jgi:hypothetical protein
MDELTKYVLDNESFFMASSLEQRRKSIRQLRTQKSFVQAMAIGRSEERNEDCGDWNTYHPTRLVFLKIEPMPCRFPPAALYMFH